MHRGTSHVDPAADACSRVSAGGQLQLRSRAIPVPVGLLAFADLPIPADLLIDSERLFVQLTPETRQNDAGHVIRVEKASPAEVIGQGTALIESPVVSDPATQALVITIGDGFVARLGEFQEDTCGHALLESPESFLEGPWSRRLAQIPDRRRCRRARRLDIGLDAPQRDQGKDERSCERSNRGIVHVGRRLDTLRARHGHPGQCRAAARPP